MEGLINICNILVASVKLLKNLNSYYCLTWGDVYEKIYISFPKMIVMGIYYRELCSPLGVPEYCGCHLGQVC